MDDANKFEARHQEIHDENTGVTITLGTHAGSGHHWMRIAVPYGTPDDRVATKTSTVTFGPDGQALKILPHVAVGTASMQAGPDGSTSTPESTDVESPRAHEIKEELHHLDEIEHDLSVHHETVKVDKSHKHGKK